MESYSLIFQALYMELCYSFDAAVLVFVIYMVSTKKYSDAKWLSIILIAFEHKIMLCKTSPTVEEPPHMV